MHELSLAVNIVGLLQAQSHQLRRITRFTLEIGSLSCVDPTALRTALSAALKGTLADGAQVVFQMRQASARCPDCQHTFEPPTRLDPCPHCGSFRKDWLQGQSCLLVSVEGLPTPPGVDE